MPEPRFILLDLREKKYKKDKKKTQFTGIKTTIYLRPIQQRNVIIDTAIITATTSRTRIMSRPGDWNCRSCNHLNFQRRDSCQRCGEPRAEFGGGGGGRGGSSSFGFTTGPDVRPGDWNCAIANCGAHNFASRSNCFKCGAAKDEGSTAHYDGDFSRMRGFNFGGASNRPGWKSGDWICARSDCNEHNFASRRECFRCNAPRDSNSTSPYL